MMMRWACVAVACWLVTIGLACGADIHYRLNLVGYAAFDAKRIIIGADERMTGKAYTIRNVSNNAVLDSGRLEAGFPSDPNELPWDFQHVLDATRIQNPGEYRVEIAGEKQHAVFTIGPDYTPALIESLLHFLRVQRCGDTQPAAHGACHLKDPTNAALDLTGGWHDAGDFLKFTRQIAYTTYLLLLSYAENVKAYPELFRDADGNGRSDVLDEARIGLDYLVKCYPDEFTFVVLVGDVEADHSQGFRMPDQDRLAAKGRPATSAFRRDDLAKYAYALALASSVFRAEAGGDGDGDRYKVLAERAYGKAKKTGAGEWDKMCLAATELFRATGNSQYLEEARQFNDRIASSDFGNYSDNTNLAHARLAPHHPQALSKLRESVVHFSEKSREHQFGFASPYRWGSLYVNLSGGVAGCLFHRLSGVNAYADLVQNVRDYTLGKNPWGLSFISGWGRVYSKYLHHNIAMFLDAAGRPAEAGAAMRGAVAEGPVSRSEWEKEFRRKAPSGQGNPSLLQPVRCVYYDYLNDYMTNEPCIYGAAEAILFFSLAQPPRERTSSPGHGPIEPSRERP